MSMHTQGPWQWYWREEKGKPECGVFHEKLKGHAYAVARCPQYQTREQWEADARLIAAAPDLLAACDLALKGFEAFEESARGNSELWMPTVLAFDTIRAAIIKARGE